MEFVPLKFENDYLLNTLTTIGVGGTVKRFVKINNLNELKYLIEDTNDRLFVIGNGSNLIFKDEIYDMTILSFRDEFEKIELLDSCTVRVGAGCHNHRMLNFLIEHDLTGFEWSSGIPATVGGLIYNNGGAFGSNVSQNLVSLKYFDIEERDIFEFDNSQCAFDYRDSIFKTHKHYIILEAIFKFEKFDKDEILKNLRKNINLRMSTQPLNQKSAGCVFKNMKGFEPTSKLLDNIGFKGHRIGNMGFSDKHANFVINYGEGKYEEFKRLVDEAKDVIFAKYKLNLELEVEVV